MESGPLGRCLDLNGNVPMLADAARHSQESNEAPSAPVFQNESGPADFELRSQGNQPLISQGASGNSDTCVMEVEEPPAGVGDQSPSNVVFPPAYFGPGGPDCSEGVEVVTERTLLPGSQTPGLGLGCSPGWALSFFGEDCFSPEVVEYATSLGQHIGSAGLEVKTQELQQQLVIEMRNLKKTRNFYQKLIQQERKNKGSECKPMLTKLKSQFEELKSKVVFLDWVKKYLEILSVEQWGLEASLLPSLVICGSGCLDLRSSQDPSVLSFGSSKGKSVLQAGSVQGLMAYLYARNVAVEGYIHQFLYTYRFLCTPEQLLQFIMEKFISAARQGPTLTRDNKKVFHRSLDILSFWIRDFKQVDFTPESKLVDTLEQFLNAEVIPRDGRGEVLLEALRHPPPISWSQSRESLLVSEEEDDSSLMCLSTDDLSRKWRFPKAVESSASSLKENAFSIAAVLPVPCYNLCDASLQGQEWLPFSKDEHSAQHVAQQLTLLQQQVFQGCHPVHFLKSRIKGIGDNAFSQNKNSSQQIQPAEGSSLLVCDAAQSEGCLQKLLNYADSVTNWISAEIVMCDSVKTQVALLTKYLWIGKHCYEWRNFATAMQVLSAMESVIVRQLPTWKHLSSKVCEILEELRAVQVFLKSDDLCLMKGEHTSPRMTLPSAHILAMHIQQLEIGAFTLTNGAYKWTKLRSIAKVVSQVHAFQGVTCPYSPDRELQDYLRRRIAWIAASDRQLMVADAGLQQSSERQNRKIQEKLKRVKASFQ